MKTITRIIYAAVCALTFLGGTRADCATYSAISTGLWSSTSTWSGGNIPPTTITADQISIPANVTVTMDNNVMLNGLSAEITVNGTLSALTGNYFSIETGKVDGMGNVNADTAECQTAAIITLAGTFAVNTLNWTATNLTVTTAVTVRKSLHLMSGILNLGTGAVLTLQNNTTIVLSGGLLTVGGGTLGLTSAYSVMYTKASSIAGPELTGSGLKDVTIDVTSSNTVTLSSSFTINGNLNLVSGTMDFSGKNLTINGQVTGTGFLSGSPSSNLTISTTGGLSSAIAFNRSNSSIHDLMIDVGSGNSVPFMSDLTVGGTLTLNAGSVMDFSGNSLTLNGNLAGSGSFISNSLSSLVCNDTSVMTSPIIFAGAKNIGNLTVNTQNSNHNVTMGSDLNVSVMLNLQSGNLVMNGRHLTITGNISGGNGKFIGTSTSDLTLNCGSTPTGKIMFANNGNKLRNLTINIGGSGGMSTLGSGLEIDGTLSFVNGCLNTDTNTLYISATGSISGNNKSSYVITGTKGYLSMALTGGGALKTYPVGTTSNYYPAGIALVTGSSSGDVEVNVGSGVFANGTSGSALSDTKSTVNATWYLGSNITSNFGMNLSLSWTTTAEVNGFDRSKCHIAHYTNGNWDQSASIAATSQGSGMYSVQRNGISSLSPFAVFDDNTTAAINPLVSALLEVYPNPADDKLMIANIPSTGDLVKVDVINMMGQVQQSSILGANEDQQISVSGLTEGDYFVRIHNDKVNIVRKFVKL